MAKRRIKKKLTGSEGGESFEAEVGWKFFKPMSFLDPIVTPHPTSSNFHSPQLESESPDESAFGEIYDEDLEQEEEMMRQERNVEDRSEMATPHPGTVVFKTPPPSISGTSSADSGRKRVLKRGYTESNPTDEMLVETLKKMQNEDEIDAFAKFIAGSIRKLTPVNQKFFMNRVNNLLFDMQMEESGLVINDGEVSTP